VCTPLLGGRGVARGGRTCDRDGLRYTVHLGAPMDSAHDGARLMSTARSAHRAPCTSVPKPLRERRVARRIETERGSKRGGHRRTVRSVRNRQPGVGFRSVHRHTRHGTPTRKHVIIIRYRDTVDLRIGHKSSRPLQ
jgi:hypothetical protein